MSQLNFYKILDKKKVLHFQITVIIYLLVTESDGKVTKKSGNDLSIASVDAKTTTTTPSTVVSKKLRYATTKAKFVATPQQQRAAIIAIEIVDPNDNSTKKRNGKRTIESSLGYGYQPSNYFPVSHRPPRYEVYKYSQEDIPPFRGPKNVYTQADSAQIHIQKSIRYELGSTEPELVPHHKSIANYNQASTDDSQYYSPGTILYSSLDQQGNVGGLSQQVPSNHHAGAMVPVIILRVFTNQLTRPGTLHPNLPQSHPYAGLNDIDLQSLLNRYVQQHTAAYPPERYYQPAAMYRYHQPQQQQAYAATQENYPDDLHTKVIFHHHHGTNQYPEMVHSPGLAEYRTKPKEIRVHVPENVFSSIQVQEHDAVPQQQHSNEATSQQMAVEEQNEEGGAGDGYYYYPTQDGAARQEYQQVDQQQRGGDDDPSERYEYVVPQRYYESAGGGGGERVEEGDAPPRKVYNYHAHAQGGDGQSGGGAREGRDKRRVGVGKGDVGGE